MNIDKYRCYFYRFQQTHSFTTRLSSC